MHASYIQRNTVDGNSQRPDGLKQDIATMIMEKLNSVYYVLLRIISKSGSNYWLLLTIIASQ
jgi:hypothetical protein